MPHSDLQCMCIHGSRSSLHHPINRSDILLAATKGRVPSYWLFEFIWTYLSLLFLLPYLLQLYTVRLHINTCSNQPEEKTVMDRHKYIQAQLHDQSKTPLPRLQDYEPHAKVFGKRVNSPWMIFQCLSQIRTECTVQLAVCKLPGLFQPGTFGVVLYFVYCWGQVSQVKILGQAEVLKPCNC